MSSELRIPSACIPVQVVCSAAYSSARCKLLPGACGSLAKRTEDHRREDTRKRILPHLLGTEHRTLPCTSPDRHRAQPDRRLPHAYGNILIFRSPCIHLQPPAESRGQEERIRARTPEHQERKRGMTIF